MSDRENARPVHVTKSEEVDTGDGQTEGMIRQSAIVDKSPSICGTLMRAMPHSSSAVEARVPSLHTWKPSIKAHPSSDFPSIVYAVSGTGAISSLDADGNEQKQILRPGDWGLIPAYREHKEVNDGDEEVVWVIVRAPGGIPEVVNLDGWKGKEEKK